MITEIQYHSDKKQIVFLQRNQHEILMDEETLLYDNRGYNHIIVYNSSNDFVLEISRPEWKEDIVSFFKESDLKCQKYEKKVSHFESIVDFLGSWS